MLHRIVLLVVMLLRERLEADAVPPDLMGFETLSPSESDDNVGDCDLDVPDESIVSVVASRVIGAEVDGLDRETQKHLSHPPSTRAHDVVQGDVSDVAGHCVRLELSPAKRRCQKTLEDKVLSSAAVTTNGHRLICAPATCGNDTSEKSISPTVRYDVEELLMRVALIEKQRQELYSRMEQLPGLRGGNASVVQAALVDIAESLSEIRTMVELVKYGEPRPLCVTNVSTVASTSNADGGSGVENGGHVSSRVDLLGLDTVKVLRHEWPPSPIVRPSCYLESLVLCGSQLDAELNATMTSVASIIGARVSRTLERGVSLGISVAGSAIEI